MIDVVVRGVVAGSIDIQNAAAFHPHHAACHAERVVTGRTAEFERTILHHDVAPAGKTRAVDCERTRTGLLDPAGRDPARADEGVVAVAADRQQRSRDICIDIDRRRLRRLRAIEQRGPAGRKRARIARAVLQPGE